MYLERLVGAVSKLLMIHFSPLMTSHPLCNVRRSTDHRKPLLGSIKLLYRMTAVPFFGGRTSLAEQEFMLRLMPSVLSISLKYNNKILLCSLSCRLPVTDYFSIRNVFFPGSEFSPFTRSVFKSNSPVYTHLMVFGFTL